MLPPGAAHLLVAYASYSVALYVLHGAEGPTWPLAEVRTLLQQTERGLKLCRPWLFADSILREQTKNQRRNVAEAAAARPGALQLPAIGTLNDTSLTENSQAPACDACGTRSPKLRRCAACKGRAYW